MTQSSYHPPMPPRQPLRLTKPARKGSKPAAPAGGSDALVSALTEAMPPEPAKARRVTSFSPYPDLSMAITMVAKRQQKLLHDGERAQLLARWLEQLRLLQADMQKLYKLEQLASRLVKK